MLVLGYDVETTGLDTSKDRIVEVGAVVWDTDKKLPIKIYSSFVSGVEILPEHSTALEINRIDPEWLKYGKPLGSIFGDLAEECAIHGIEYIVAHNGENYDKPITMAEAERGGFKFPELTWLDTRMDLPFEVEPKSRSLNHLALDQGFINHFAHRAVFDVLTMLKVMSAYDFSKIVEMSKVPWVIVRAMVDYDNREKAKEARFSWEMIGTDKYPKCWVKKIRENQLEAEVKRAEEKNFKVLRIK